jgi:hypothetical protein
MWKNIVVWGRPQMTIWHVHISCWIPKATDTFRICSIYCCSTATMVARMRSMLHYTYIACLSPPPPLHTTSAKKVYMHCYVEKMWCLLESSPKIMQSNGWHFKSQDSTENIGYLILVYSGWVNAMVSTLYIHIMVPLKLAKLSLNPTP